MKFTPLAMPKAVFVDVDGTLEIKPGLLDVALVDRLKELKAGGNAVYLWSAQGKAHAEEVAARHNLLWLFEGILPKPGMIADDLGWSWVKRVKRLPHAGIKRRK